MYEEITDSHELTSTAKNHEAGLNDMLRNYLNHKTFAMEKGCCLEKPTLCTLIHIYCDTIKNQTVNPTQVNMVKELAV